MFMDRFPKPTTPAKHDSDIDATVILTGSPKPQRPPSPVAAREAVLVDAMKHLAKRYPKALRLAQRLHNGNIMFQWD
jgi:hypothetical protein